MEDLAIFGGPQTIAQPVTRYNPIGREELEAVQGVMENGVLSQFLGVWSPEFYGGPKIQELERSWEKYFDVRHAVSVNSNTSGLIAALGAIGLEPGDEVIVSPWTMSASATSILVWNAIPVFADIEEQTFNLDPISIKENLTPYTRAIMLPDIFGHPADLDEIMEIASEHNLKVIEDSAQAPGSRYNGRYTGTVADIGVFSLNYHKHIHTGEGGICVTNDVQLAERMQLIRNHAEAVVGAKGVTDLSNMIGFNFRMGEIEAAIGIEQLKKLGNLVDERIAVAESFRDGLKELDGLRMPVVKPGATHVYYVFPLVYDETLTGVSRDNVVKALQAEGVRVTGTYCNLHLLPIFQKKMAYGKGGYPWSAPFYHGDVSYAKGICPVAERLQESAFIGIGICFFRYSDEEVEMVIKAFRKVWNRMDLIRQDLP